MGVRNLRAICPNCGGKIHTQPKGLGHFTWANSWMLVQTGSECQHCGVALSGKVAADNKAILADDAEKTWWERETGSDRSRIKREALNAGPVLSREQKKADVIECEYAASPDEVFAAIESAIDRLGYKSSAQDAAAVLASREQRMLGFKTKMSMTAASRRMEVTVRAGEDGATVLSLIRKKRPGELFDMGEKNEVTRRFLGAVQAVLSR